MSKAYQCHILRSQYFHRNQVQGTFDTPPTSIDVIAQKEVMHAVYFGETPPQGSLHGQQVFEVAVDVSIKKRRVRKCGLV